MKPTPFGLTGKTEKILNEVSPNGKFTNAAAINKNGNQFSCGGKQNFLDENSPLVDGDTMFAEGSVGKIRFAGLAWMLQQDGIIDLQRNANGFFHDKKFGEFLKKKYPDQAKELQNRIVSFFAGETTDQTSSASATLADLFTHRAGIGDLTRAGVRAVENQGVEHEFTLPELILDGIKNNPDLIDENGKPRAHRPIDMPIPDNELPESKHGNHEYSNLNYWIGALAMEFAYSQKYPEKELKDYKQLTRDFMLDPLELKSTKFPKEIHEEDNVFIAHRLEHDENGKEKIVNANKCSSANAAGGIFASANDSTKFFEEFFRGFPGTEENGKETENKFFTPETIQAMKEEWTKYPPANNPQKDGFFRFQGPGFTVDYPYNEKFYQDKKGFFNEETPTCYCKSGGTTGYNSWFEFNPKTGDALISVDAQENFTGEIAKNLAAERGDVFVGENEKETNQQRQKNTENFINQYRDPETDDFDRLKMIQENLPEIFNREQSDEESKKSDDPKITESKGETPFGGKWVTRIIEERNKRNNQEGNSNSK